MKLADCWVGNWGHGSGEGEKGNRTELLWFQRSKQLVLKKRVLFGTSTEGPPHPIKGGRRHTQNFILRESQKDATQHFPPPHTLGIPGRLDPRCGSASPKSFHLGPLLTSHPAYPNPGRQSPVLGGAAHLARPGETQGPHRLPHRWVSYQVSVAGTGSVSLETVAQGTR